MGCDRKLVSPGCPAHNSVRTALLVLALLSPHVCEANEMSADELLSRAVSLATSARLDDAERVLLEGKSAFAHDARFPVELAGVAWRKKLPARAKHYLRQGLRLDPSNAYADEFLGSLYVLDGNLFAAVKYWNRIHRPVVAGVDFEPNPPLARELLERLPAVSAGQLLTGVRLGQTELNLERLRMFSDPRFELTPAPNNEYTLVVRSPVLSQPLSGVTGRLLPVLRGLPYQQINLDWTNIERRAAAFTSLWRWDSDKRRIAMRYGAPLALGAYAVWTDLRDEHWDLNWSGLMPSAVGVRSATLGGEIEFDLGGGKRWTPGIQLSRHTFRNAG